MQTAKSRNTSVVVLRLMGILMVVVCHMLPYFSFLPGIGAVEQILNIGIYIFILISGYLYGGKTVDRFGKWFLGRWTRVGLPAVLISVIAWAALALCGKSESAPFTALVPYLLCLQGLPFVSYPLFGTFIRIIPGLDPLWFITIILLCYLAVPLLQALRDRLREKDCRWAGPAAVGGLFVLSFVLSLACDVTTVYLAVFSLGYLLGSRSSGEKVTPPVFLTVTLLTLLLQTLRIVLWLLADDTPLYVSAAAQTQAGLAVWVVMLVFLLHRTAPRLIDAIGQARFVLWLDKMSFFIYLTHGLFCTGTAFNMYLLTGHLGLGTLAFLACTVVSAIGLYWLHKGIMTGTAALTGDKKNGV